MSESCGKSVGPETLHRAKVNKDNIDSVPFRPVHSRIRPWKHDLRAFSAGSPLLDATQGQVLSLETEFPVYESREFPGRTLSPRWMNQEDPQPGTFIDLVGEDVLRYSRPVGRRALACNSH
jgi:hypothetical protein